MSIIMINYVVNKSIMLFLSDFQKKLPFKIKSGSCSYSVREYLSPNYNMEIDYDVFLPSKGKNLQRPFCWTLEQKQSLILSVFKGLEIPSVSFIYYAEKNLQDKQTHKVIDGKQRLSTVLNFAKNEFAIEFEGHEYFFKDLSKELQDYYYRFTFTQNVVYEYADAMISDDHKILWFNMINWAGTPQDKAHMEDLLK